MRRLSLAALAAVVLALVVPAGHAAAPDVMHGGCFVDTLSKSAAGSNENVGAIGADSVTTTGDFPPAPIGATVTCWIEVNFVEAPGTRFHYSGFGAQAGIDPVSFVATDSDFVEGCESVRFADGTTDSGCPIGGGDPQIPPQFVLDWLNAVFDDLTAAEIAYVDPAVCPALVAAAGSYGPVTIGPDGDVFLPDPYDLGLTPVYDCPPYRTP
ncbi:MAG: hypothetical protein QOD07_23 [Frankiaceae bacterium]|jgi:hypothetical protein|nr:hypothetical protein [Frankiaceae bacterium]